MYVCWRNFEFFETNEWFWKCIRYNRPISLIVFLIVLEYLSVSLPSIHIFIFQTFPLLWIPPSRHTSFGTSQKCEVHSLLKQSIYLNGTRGNTVSSVFSLFISLRAKLLIPVRCLHSVIPPVMWFRCWYWLL